MLHPCRVHKPCVQITPSFRGHRGVDHGRCRCCDRESLWEESTVLRDLVACGGVRMVRKRCLPRGDTSHKRQLSKYTLKHRVGRFCRAHLQGPLPRYIIRCPAVFLQHDEGVIFSHRKDRDAAPALIIWDHRTISDGGKNTETHGVGGLKDSLRRSKEIIASAK